VSETKPKIELIPPFVVEADHPQNCDLMLQCIPGARLRSTIKSTTVDASGKNFRTQTVRNHQLPSVPGMRLAVHPLEGTYLISDPLNDDEDAQQALKAFLVRVNQASKDSVMKGEKEVRGKLDIHQMKSLCREVFNLAEEKVIKVIEGSVPTMQDILDMDGEFLLNPGSRISNTQPRFEIDFQTWVDQLSRSGG